MEIGSFKGHRIPKKIIQKGRTFMLRSDAGISRKIRYLAEDDGITPLDAVLVLALISGDGPTHGCRIDQSAGFVSGDELDNVGTSVAADCDSPPDTGGPGDFDSGGVDVCSAGN